MSADIQQFRVGPSGHGMVLRATFTGSGAANLVGGALIVRPKRHGHYIKARFKEFADPDGDLVAGADILALDGEARASVYLPFCAFPETSGTISLEMIPIRPDGHRFQAQSFDDIPLAAAEFQRRHAIAAICDGAVGGVRMQGDVAPIHIRTAEEEITNSWRLDAHGVRELQQHLRYAASTALDTHWFLAERIALDIGDELSGSDRVVALRMLYRISGAGGGVGERADSLFREVARLLGIPASDIESIRAEFRADVHIEILGLKPGASSEEIKRAFRRIAKQCHPDVVRTLDPAARASAEEMFRAAKAAHDRLMARS